MKGYVSNKENEEKKKEQLYVYMTHQAWNVSLDCSKHGCMAYCRNLIRKRRMITMERETRDERERVLFILQEVALVLLQE